MVEQNLLNMVIASCINSHDSIFIGEKIKISFSIKSLFKINDDIFFINKNSQTIHSIIDRYSKPINYSTKYNKNYIKYNKSVNSMIILKIIK